MQETNKPSTLLTPKAEGGTESVPGFWGRMSKALQYVISGADTWMGPGQPMAPQQQGIPTRRFDYPVFVNTAPTPSATSRGTYSGEPSYFQLRALADGYDLMRGLIQMRKNQILGMKWKALTVDRDPDATITPKEEAVAELLRHPTESDNWESWIGKLIEEILVVDVACVYPTVINGKLKELPLVDGGTFKKLLDARGELPVPPSPAYQQIIKGVPGKDYTRDEIWMRHMVPRVHKIYGFSPVEQVIMTVNIALRRQMYQLEFYTQGNIPDALATAPEQWSREDIVLFQNWFDSVMEGSGARRKMKFLPVDATKIKTLEKKDLTDKTDEWLARVTCFVFGIDPTALVSTFNRATSETAKETSQEVSVGPLLKFVEGFINDLLQAYGYSDVLFSWDRTPDMDPEKQSDIYVNYVKAGVLSIDEVRDKLGYPKLNVPPMVFTQQGPVPVTAFAAAKLPLALAGPQGEEQGGQAEEGQEETPPPGKEAVTGVVQLRPKYNKFYQRDVHRSFEEEVKDMLEGKAGGEG